MKHTFTLQKLIGISQTASFKLKDVVIVRACLLKLLILIISASAWSTHATEINNDDIQVASKVLPIGSNYQNSIQLLNNRFRIDSDVKEVTLVFFREYGSTPIVLVRPDGSKLFLENDSADNTYEWFETDTYDMISLQSPMPGPWQAVGDVLPGSRVMVIAGIRLNAEPIPNPIYSGETIKQTAYLENAGSKVDFSSFRELVSLSIDFVSTNNPSEVNFGIGSRSVARFEDNGLGFDEFEGDGIFTGEFDLTISEGEWRPIFTLKTPLFSREQMDDKINLLPNPITISHQLKVNEQGDHQVTIQADAEQVALDSVLVDGSVRHSNGETVHFSVTEKNNEAKIIPIIHTEFGLYKVNMTVYALNAKGRDIVLTVPEYTFITKAPEIVVEPVQAVTELKKTSILIELPKAPIEPENSFLMWALIINTCLLLSGGLVVLVIVYKRNNPQQSVWQGLKQKCSRNKNKPEESVA